ncbi:MAG: alpha/beta fold hydrolase, partial [Solimonas sp.]
LRLQEPLDPTPLKRLDAPTLILWGAQDRWTPVADAFRFQNDIKGAKLEIFEKLGHNPMEEDPKATAAALAAFLQPIPKRPRPPTPPPASTDQTVHPSVRPEKD